VNADSSTVVAFRALVMLACLVVAPSAAIFGSAFPEVVRTWLINPLLGRTTTASADDHGSRAGGGGVFNGVGYGGYGSSGPGSQAGSPGTGYAAAGAGEWGSPDHRASPLASPAGNASLAPLPFSPANGAKSLDGGSPAPNAAPTPSGGLFSGLVAGSAGPPAANASRGSASQVGFSTLAESAPASELTPGAGAAGQTMPAVHPGGENGQFAWFEKKLREYGANYYLLETWGNEGELYRFQCKMAVANNPAYSRHFEAMDRDKLQAMARVLEQVEAWRNGRLP